MTLILKSRPTVISWKTRSYNLTLGSSSFCFPSDPTLTPVDWGHLSPTLSPQDWELLSPQQGAACLSGQRRDSWPLCMWIMRWRSRHYKLPKAHSPSPTPQTLRTKLLGWLPGEQPAGKPTAGIKHTRSLPRPKVRLHPCLWASLRASGRGSLPFSAYDCFMEEARPGWGQSEGRG